MTEEEYTAILIRAKPEEIREIKTYVLINYPNSCVKVSTGITFQDAIENVIKNPISQTGLYNTSITPQRNDNKYHQELDYD